MEPLFTDTFDNTPEALAAFLMKMQTAMKRGNDVPAHLELVTEEICADLIFRGYDAPGGHPIVFAVCDNAGALMVTLDYAGTTYDPIAAAPPADLLSSIAERKTRGLGLRISKSFTDYMFHEPIPSGNRITFQLKPGLR